MDIIITIPKDKNYEKWLRQCLEVAENPNLTVKHNLGNEPFPKKTKVGDKCFVVYDGYIRGYHIISGFKNKEVPFKCLTTRESYEPGNYIESKGDFFMTPLIKKKDFEGRRYFDKKVKADITIPNLDLYPKVSDHRPFLLGDALLGEITEIKMNDEGAYETVVEFWNKNILDKFLEIHKKLNGGGIIN